MSVSEVVISRTVSRQQNMVLWAFTLTLFTSALLLFGVQPLFAKIVLPKLGGSTAVWSVALVFFQGVLLLGYLYAHALSRWVPTKFAIPLHIAVLASAFIFLPLVYPAGWQEPPQSGLSIWLIGLFGVGVGFPFFAVSANAPLLQSWFAKTGHPQSSDPYFLYAASNIGSFASLLIYPFLIEPVSTLGAQTMGWSIIYGVLVIAVALCGAIVWKRADSASVAVQTTTSKIIEKDVTWNDRAKWIGLSMVPSGLLVAVTAYVATDLVSAPFLWVLPLALFLLTFVITFAQNPIISHSMVLKLHAFAVAPLLITMFVGAANLTTIIIHLAAFFISALVAHGELVRRRPDARHLTEFYLWMSFGGVLGGFFASLIAPNIFSKVFEYPILLLVVFACRRDFWLEVAKRDFRLAWPLLLFTAPFVFGMIGSPPMIIKIAYVAAIIITVLLRRNTFQQALFVAGVVSIIYTFGIDHNAVERVRSFFGVNTIVAMENGKYNVLFHGSTIHGAEQRLDGARKPLASRPEPLTYYYRDGGLYVAVGHLRASQGSLGDVAVVGLGTGAMACHRKPGESWRFIEIDPEVIKIARDPKLFRFLSVCGESAGIVAGDGRIALAKEPAKKFDVIILDAFSSDSIPVHLMTEEALALYFDKLKPGGAIVFHISNRFMELASVVAAVANTQGAQTYVSVRNEKIWKEDITALKTMPVVAVVSRSEARFEQFKSDKRWYKFDKSRMSKPWSDDFSNLLGAIYRGYKDDKLTRAKRQ